MNGKQAKRLRKLTNCGVKTPKYAVTAWGQTINIGMRQKYKVAKKLYMCGILVNI